MSVPAGNTPLRPECPICRVPAIQPPGKNYWNCPGNPKCSDPMDSTGKQKMWSGIQQWKDHHNQRISQLNVLNFNPGSRSAPVYSPAPLPTYQNIQQDQFSQFQQKRARPDDTNNNNNPMSPPRNQSDPNREILLSMLEFNRILGSNIAEMSMMLKRIVDALEKRTPKKSSKRPFSEDDQYIAEGKQESE